MTPKEYYYNQFRQDFGNFWSKVPHRSNFVTGEPLFKFAGLVKDNGFDVFEDISKDNLIYFLSALACTILIDQVMYTHFRNDYSVFQGMTLYPKMWVAWVNADPWMVFSQNIRLPRRLYEKETIDGFAKFAEFFIKDLKEFSKKYKFSEANWKTVKSAMLNDPDVSKGSYGKIFIEELKKIE